MPILITSLYTVADGDIIEVQTSAYEKYPLIIKKQIFEIGQDEDSGKFGIRIRNDEDGEVILTLDSGEYLDLNTVENPEPGFKLTLVSQTAAPEKYTFRIDFNNPPCLNSIPSGWINILINDLVVQETNPHKVWADFNEYHNNWEDIIYLAQQGLICYNQIPDEPKIEDYH